MIYSKLTDEQKSEARDMGYQPMFANRDTMEQAKSYSDLIINSLPPSDQIAVLTGLQVMENTKILSSFNCKG